MAVRNLDFSSANDVIRGYLEQVFGTRLRGVSGYGAALDYVTRTPVMNVMTTSATAADLARSKLPADIDGLPVKVTQRGPAIFD